MSESGQNGIDESFSLEQYSELEISPVEADDRAEELIQRLRSRVDAPSEREVLDILAELAFFHSKDYLLSEYYHDQIAHILETVKSN